MQKASNKSNKNVPKHRSGGEPIGPGPGGGSGGEGLGSGGPGGGSGGGGLKNKKAKGPVKR
jgi:hypothetical protein